MQRIILHIDFDSFYASVEQQDNPLYRNRPLGVTATNGRTAIIAASREAKKLGIKSPSTTYDAKRICPSIIFVPARFTRYLEISKIFLKICDDFSPVVEVFSLDEVFMDVSLTAKLFGGVDGLIVKLKERLHKEIGEYVTVSVGVSHNRMLAKMASGLAKPACRQAGPNGVMKITPENMLQVYASAELTDICGIGFRVEKRLHNLGITSLLQLRTIPLSSLIAEFGNVAGHFLHNVGIGYDDSVVTPYAQKAEVKSVGRQYCLPQNEYNKRIVLQNVYELCEEVALKLRRLRKKARTVGIYLGGSENVGGRLTTERYIDTGREVFELGMESLNFQDPNNKLQIKSNNKISNFNNFCDLLLGYWNLSYVRRIGIWTGNLEDVKNVPAPLFLKEQREETINHIIDKINEKFGDHTIRNGFLLYADKLTTVPNGYGASVRHEFGESLTSDSKINS